MIYNVILLHPSNQQSLPLTHTHTAVLLLTHFNGILTGREFQDTLGNKYSVITANPKPATEFML